MPISRNGITHDENFIDLYDINGTKGSGSLSIIYRRPEQGTEFHHLYYRCLKQNAARASSEFFTLIMPTEIMIDIFVEDEYLCIRVQQENKKLQGTLNVQAKNLLKMITENLLNTIQTVTIPAENPINIFDQILEPILILANSHLIQSPSVPVLVSFFQNLTDELNNLNNLLSNYAPEESCQRINLSFTP